MRRKYLIIDKRQRVKINGEKSYVLTRLKEEILNQKDSVDIYYLDEIKVLVNNNQFKVQIKNNSILDYSHILIRGHITLQEYLLKKIIIEEIQSFNKTADNRILVQNLQAYNLLPYYNKLSQAQIALHNNIPYLNSEYSLGFNKPSLNSPFVMKNLFGENTIERKNGELVVKKQIYKFSKSNYKSSSIKEKNYYDFFAQEFINTGIDYRVYLQGKDILYVVERKSKDSFITVSGGEYTLINNVPADIAQIAIKTAKVFKSDFCAIDLIIKEDTPYLLEINLNPGFKALEQKILKQKCSIGKKIVNSFNLQ